MENRQPTYPGRVKLTPVPGSTDLYDMERADQPTAEGTPLNKATLLQDATCSILNIPDTSVPNDAFAKLALGIGKYGYVITVLLPDGTPVPGASLTGINAPNGEPAITNENGQAVGVSTEQSVNISVNSPYIDMQNSNEFTVESNGILTEYSVTLQPKDTVNGFLIQESNVYTLSPRVLTYDLTAIGGGGGGCGGDYYKAGAGGGGGYIVTVLGIVPTDDKKISVQIGAGAPATYATQSPGVGGTTTVSAGDTTLISAAGGHSAIASNDNSTDGIGGAGNGAGGTYGTNNGNGNAGSGYKFNDQSLGVPGGGGGAAGAKRTSERPIGGSPFGGNGARNGVSAQKGKGPGGGGGGGMNGTSYLDGANGADGGLYVRCHYTDEVAA